jgi:hypothetical protein
MFFSSSKKFEENVCACFLITNVLHERLLASWHTSLPMYCMNVLHHGAGIEPRSFPAGSVALSTRYHQEMRKGVQCTFNKLLNIEQFFSLQVTEEFGLALGII